MGLYCLNCLYSMLSSISLLKLREDIRNLMLIIFMLPKGCQTKLLSDNQSGPINCDSKVYVYLITKNNRYVFQIIQGTGTRANSEIFQKGLRRKFWRNVMSYSLKTEQMNIPHSLFLFFFLLVFFFFFASYETSLNKEIFLGFRHMLKISLFFHTYTIAFPVPR